MARCAVRKNVTSAVRKMLSMAMWMIVVAAPIQAVIGDFHGINTLKHQPAKIAALEGHWENRGQEALPLILKWTASHRACTAWCAPATPSRRKPQARWR